MFLKKIPNIFSKLSIKFRLTLLYVIIFGTTTLAFNMILFHFTLNTVQQDFDDALYNYAIDVSESVEIGEKGDLSFPPLHLDHGKVLPFQLGTALIQVRHHSGEILAQMGNFGKFNPPYKKAFEQISNGEDAHFSTVENTDIIPNAEAETYRLINFPLDSLKKPQLVLQIAVPLTLLETAVKERINLIILGIPFVLLFAAIVGFFLSSRALRPIERMITTANEINVSDLSRRIPLSLANDEVRKLGETLNAMLERIEQAFTSQERFIADASHQLLTPLTIMKGEIEHYIRTSNNEITNKSFESLLQEVDQLSSITQRMLLLARVDAGLGALNLQDINIDELLIEVLGKLNKISSVKNVKLVLNLDPQQNHSPMIKGDFDLFKNLILNLIENAIKYSDPNSSVQVETSQKDGFLKITVTDQGPGISADQIDFIFNRFSRAPSTTKKSSGFGLGLAIAKKIADLHGAQLSASNNLSRGAKFSIEIKNL